MNPTTNRATQAASSIVRYMYLRLEGKVALVAGGSRGSGRAIAAAFATAGANVMAASRNAEACVEAANTIEKNCKWVASNVGHGGQVEALAAVKPEPTK